jgi:glycosyltransferase involved in cell wall biosynthesis
MSPHVLIIADGRSPTTRSWITNIQSLGYQVSLISTFYCDPPEYLHQFYTLPVALSRLSRKPSAGAQLTMPSTSKTKMRSILRRFAPLLQSLRYTVGPLTLLRFAPTYRNLARAIKPDLVHALRIPFEGMLGSYTPEEIPFVAATWGNDLTLHASGSRLMRIFTKRCLTRADGFTADTDRDLRLAHAWGLSEAAPTLVLPGSGGLDLDAILAVTAFDPTSYAIPAGSDWVVNPRGLRPGSVHQEVFFAAIPEVIAKYPNAHFICPGLQDHQQAHQWVSKYRIEKNTTLLPKLPQTHLWSLLKRAKIYVSPSSHDGTPNSLLEAMASGCFPVVGDIDSLREWIEGGVNGLLVNPRDPHDLAAAISHALGSADLRQKAACHNLKLVRERAAREATLPQINAFYRKFIA